MKTSLSIAFIISLSLTQLSKAQHRDDAKDIAFFKEKIEPLLQDYCYDCHGDGEDKGNFRLDSFGRDPQSLEKHVTQYSKHWEQIWQNLRSELMPPSKKSQPTPEERQLLLSWIERGPFQLTDSQPNPGRLTIRRMNRLEYHYSILDVFGVTFDTNAYFPPDDTGYGFDTIGETLNVSPLLMEKYLSAAEKIAQKAMPLDFDEPTTLQKRLFKDKRPPENAALRKEFTRELLGRLSSIAYRRPISEHKVNQLYTIVTKQDNGDLSSYLLGIQQTITAIIASPSFIYRREYSLSEHASDGVALIDEFSLASRLSYFLWKSTPDVELLKLASERKLRSQIDVQIKRLLAHPKAQRFTEDFSGQWLQTRNTPITSLDSRRILDRAGRLDNIPRNKWKFEFTQEHLIDMKRETDLFFAHIFFEERPAEELLTAKYSFLNQRLAKHYGIKGITSQKHEKVDLTDYPERKGILTQGSFLVLTSDPRRTSPVKRGQFVLETFIGAPAPPAPPNVPALPDSRSQNGKKLSIRESMQMHRDNPDCRSCHLRMDPIGLGLEQYDALGLYREEEHRKPIDPAGKLVTGESFQSVSELSDILANKRRSDFYWCLSEKLFTYGLGRGPTYQDIPTIRSLTDSLHKNNGNLKSLVSTFIHSTPFQKTVYAPNAKLH